MKTQSEIAKELGITRQYLNAILRGRMRPSLKIALKINQLLGVPLVSIRPDLKDVIKRLLA